MNIEEAYNNWSEQYDSNINKTRDAEAVSLRETLEHIHFSKCLEIGCGTGKNTVWLINKADEITAVDLSEKMLNKARMKLNSGKINFIQADINKDWNFCNKKFDLITFSLVLEHIENLEPVLKKAHQHLETGGHLYIGELHPFKQYSGSKARFEDENGVQVVTCFTHHISNFTGTAIALGFELITLNEYFDDNDRANIPRILTLLFRKK